MLYYFNFDRRIDFPVVKTLYPTPMTRLVTGQNIFEFILATFEVDPNYRTTGLDRKKRIDRSNYNRFDTFFLGSHYVTETAQLQSVLPFRRKVALESVQCLRTISELAQKHKLHPTQIKGMSRLLLKLDAVSLCEA